MNLWIVIFWLISQVSCVFLEQFLEQDRSFAWKGNFTSLRNPPPASRCEFEFNVKPLAFFGHQLDIAVQKTEHLQNDFCELKIAYLDFYCGNSHHHRCAIHFSTRTTNKRMLIYSFIIPSSWKMSKANEIVILASDEDKIMLKSHKVAVANFVLSADVPFVVDGQILGIWAHCTLQVAVESLKTSFEEGSFTSKNIPLKSQIVGPASVLLANFKVPSFKSDSEAEFLWVQVEVENGNQFSICIPILMCKIPLGRVFAIAGETFKLQLELNLKKFTPTKAVIKNPSESVIATSNVVSVSHLANFGTAVELQIDSAFKDFELVYVDFYYKDMLMNSFGFVVPLANFSLSLVPGIFVPESTFALWANCAAAIPIVDSVVFASENHLLEKRIRFNRSLIVGTNTFVGEMQLPREFFQFSYIQIRVFSDEMQIFSGEFPVGKVLLLIDANEQEKFIGEPIEIHALCQFDVTIGKICVENDKGIRTMLSLNPKVHLERNKKQLVLKYYAGMEFKESKMLHFVAYFSEYVLSDQISVKIIQFEFISSKFNGNQMEFIIESDGKCPTSAFISQSQTLNASILILNCIHFTNGQCSIKFEKPFQLEKDNFFNVNFFYNKHECHFLPFRMNSIDGNTEEFKNEASFVSLSLASQEKNFCGMQVQIQAISNENPIIVDSISIEHEEERKIIIPINPSIQVTSNEKVFITSFYLPTKPQIINVNAHSNGKKISQKPLPIEIFPQLQANLFLTVEPVTFLVGSRITVFGTIIGAAALIDSLGIGSQKIEIFPSVTIINGRLAIATILISESKSFLEVNAFWRNNKVNHSSVFIFQSPFFAYAVSKEDFVEIWAYSILNSQSRISLISISTGFECEFLPHLKINNGNQVLLAKFSIETQEFTLNVTYNGVSLLPEPKFISLSKIVQKDKFEKAENFNLPSLSALESKMHFLSSNSDSQIKSSTSSATKRYSLNSSALSATKRHSLNSSALSATNRHSLNFQANSLANEPFSVILSIEAPTFIAPGESISLYATCTINSKAFQIDSLEAFCSTNHSISKCIPLDNCWIHPSEKTLILSNWQIPNEFTFCTNFFFQASYQGTKIPNSIRIAIQAKKSFQHMLPIVGVNSFHFRSGESIQVLMKPRAPSYAGVKFAGLKLYAGIKLIAQWKDFSINMPNDYISFSLGHFLFSKDTKITLRYVAVIGKEQRIECSSHCCIYLNVPSGKKVSHKP